MQTMWEMKGVVPISTIDEEQIVAMLSRPNWASESMFGFVEGLIRLQEIEPRRVRLPSIQRVLGKDYDRE